MFDHRRDFDFFRERGGGLFQVWDKICLKLLSQVGFGPSSFQRRKPQAAQQRLKTHKKTPRQQEWCMFFSHCLETELGAVGGFCVGCGTVRSHPLCGDFFF